ncbi:substrate-binding domain-containing protein [Pontibacillus yanchengensis]|uniref:Substrate-binding domain-containing protein n=2 Tax=Pontibacillus yanchengensis TaxID=462910 RepID=A0ACC7VCM1_9BACI|nr:LacI family DNA-binding transcriptional regulator [Pontibacillus yanchengensis]MYL32156.1 substrate-binding domain-containing protein [Pontibacillus yanchengensis]MYL52736.1 substrate-binding domain-containing protein [Pontibacillus yanchengensis]
MSTMKDVAQKAGVGLGTVSRVINRTGSVKESTRIKVEQAIKDLNYQPNEVARNFKMQQSQSVALIVPSIWHPFFSEFAYFVEKTLSSNGYKMILCNSESDAQKEINYINMLEKNKIDGLIAITYSEDIDQYVSSNLPIVSIDRHFTEDVVYITSDNHKGGQMAAQQLVNRGCTNIAFMGSISTIKNESMYRRNGFEEKAQEIDISCVIFEKEEPIEHLEQTIEGFVSEHPELDGIFAMNDKWARIIINTLEKQGKNIPKDVQVIGYDGLRSSKEAGLTFSTIRQPVQDMGEQAVTALLNIIHEEPVKSRIVLPVEFYDGFSTV